MASSNLTKTIDAKRYGGPTTCSLSLDGPGTLSSNGPRHTNDHVAFENISILPSLDEIRASRCEYLPSNQSSEWHRPGIQGVLDRNFRLLREDKIGPIRDAISLDFKLYAESTHGYQPRTLEATHQVHVYQDVEIIRLFLDEMKGLVIEISFPQPPQAKYGAPGYAYRDPLQARKTWWELSDRLGDERLVALLFKDQIVVFCTITQDLWRFESKTNQNGPKRHSKPPKSLFSHVDKAYTHLKLVDNSSTSTAAFLQNVIHLQEFRILEFHDALFPSFAPTLKVLKEMAVHAHVPFSEYLAPGSKAPTSTAPPAPQYAQQRGFSFDLGSVTVDSAPMRFHPSKDFDMSRFRQLTTLDSAQAEAVVSTLKSRLALIQGPPGTGKSFTGVSLIKILLANKDEAKLGPIICVCYTNHALDQLLEHLIEDGVSRVVRIGSQSKSHVVQHFKLRDAVKSIASTASEKTHIKESRQHVAYFAQLLNRRIRELHQVDFQKKVLDHLRRSNLLHFHDLYMASNQSHGEANINEDSDQILSRWLDQGGSGVARSLQELDHELPSRMSHEERARVYQHWMSIVKQDLCEELRKLLELYNTSRELHKSNLLRKDSRVAERQDIIGVTSSGLVKNIDLFRRLPAKVLLCEEAGEVLEAHTITSLLPTTEHAILIGDHQQLRPQVKQHRLSRELSSNNSLAFDMSLFERLVHPVDSRMARLPLCTLDTQRRMHPVISRLVRNTLYPMLQDHRSVSEYPPVSGIRHRLFWIDHQRPESGYEGSVDEGTMASYCNVYEVEYCVALVSHLLRHGSYRAKDIAVITPYKGQLLKLRRALGEIHQVALDQRDLYLLHGVNVHANHNPGDGNCSTASAPDAMRLATVDNFQGEEAKLVVVSLVRSNKESKCGFLKTSNRVNVMLSRAQHGMFIIGNADTYDYSGAKIWQEVLKMLRDAGQIGADFELHCPRHASRTVPVKTPQDILRVSRSGGCGAPCHDKLPCGHHCPSACHRKLQHNNTACKVCCLTMVPDRESSILTVGQIDESIRKFFAWSSREYMRFSEVLKNCQNELWKAQLPMREQRLQKSIAIDLTGTLTQQIEGLRESLGLLDLFTRYEGLMDHFEDVRRHRVLIREMESSLQELNVACGSASISPNKHCTPQVSRNGRSADAVLLLLKCHCTILADLLALVRGVEHLFREVMVCVQLQSLRELCIALIKEAREGKCWAQAAEAHSTLAHYAIIERAGSRDVDSIGKSGEMTLLALEHIELAKELCKEHPEVTEGLLEEAEMVEELAKPSHKTLTEAFESRFVDYVDTSEQRFAAIRARTVQSSDNAWCLCINGHLFSVSEGALVIECPICGDAVASEENGKEEEAEAKAEEDLMTFGESPAIDRGVEEIARLLSGLKI